MLLVLNAVSFRNTNLVCKRENTEKNGLMGTGCARKNRHCLSPLLVDECHVVSTDERVRVV